MEGKFEMALLRLRMSPKNKKIQKMILILIFILIFIDSAGPKSHNRKGEKVLSFKSVEKLLKGKQKFLNGFESKVFAIKKITAQFIKY